MLADVQGSLVTDIQRSEIAHSLYQAMSRGSCRDTVDGHAKPMKAWLIHHDNGIHDIINKVMPGVSWSVWTPKHLTQIDAKTDEVVLKVLGYLRSLPDTETKVSTRVVKDVLGLRDSGVSENDNHKCHHQAGWRMVQPGGFWRGGHWSGPREASVQRSVQPSRNLNAIPYKRR